MRPLTFLLLASIAGLLAGSPSRASRAPWNRPSARVTADTAIAVNARELRALLGHPSTCVLDARGRDRFESGHIAGARSLDAREIVADLATLPAELKRAGVPAGGTIVCYADSADPSAAGRLFWLLELAGRSDVRVLAGGLDGWRAAHGTTRRGIAKSFTAPAATSSDPAPDTSRIADRELVREVIGRTDWVLVDWRAKSDWERAHIPHSLPFDFPAASREAPDLDGRKFKARFEVLGPRAGETVNMSESFVVFGDVPAGSPIHPYLAARLAGLEHVRCYDGGWTEWSSRKDAPAMRLVDARAVAELIGPQASVSEDIAPCPGVILMDLRGEQEYQLGHVPGSVHVPMYQFEKDVPGILARDWPGADPATTPVVLYCYGPDCTRSRRAASALSHLGFVRLLWFRGSVWEWKGAGFPLVETR